MGPGCLESRFRWLKEGGGWGQFAYFTYPHEIELKGIRLYPKPWQFLFYFSCNNFKIHGDGPVTFSLAAYMGKQRWQSKYRTWCIYPGSIWPHEGVLYPTTISTKMELQENWLNTCIFASQATSTTVRPLRSMRMDTVRPFRSMRMDTVDAYGVLMACEYGTCSAPLAPTLSQE